MHESFKEAWAKDLIDRDFSFEVGGKKYYRASKEGLDTAYHRFEAARQFAAENERFGTTRELNGQRLRAAAENLEVALKNQDWGAVAEAQKFIWIAIGDADFGNPADEKLDLMSCFFFGADESPYYYDRTKNQEKKLHWLNHLEQIDHFFFTSSFLGSLNLLETFRQGSQYVTTAQSMTAKDAKLLEVAMLQRIVKQGEDALTNIGTNSPLFWRTEMGLKLIELNEQLLSSSTSIGGTE